MVYPDLDKADIRASAGGTIVRFADSLSRRALDY